MILVSIVTFNPLIHKVLNIVESLKNYDYRIIIVDNFSDNQLEFKEVISGHSEIKFISLSNNLGIAYGQNIAINYAYENKFDYIIFFDQDSFINNSLISNLLFEFSNLSLSHNVAAIGPRFIDEKKGFYFPALKFNKNGLIDKVSVENIKSPMEVSFLISSGTLVSINALRDIGLMRDEFFIDFVDTEWCFRALSKGYKLFMSEKAIMKHSIGDDTLKIANFNIPVHSGFRRYYRIRNLFFMWKMPYVPKILVIKLMITNFGIQILLLLTKNNKADYIKYYIKAIRDGLKQSKNYRV